MAALQTLVTIFIVFTLAQEAVAQGGRAGGPGNSECRKYGGTPVGKRCYCKQMQSFVGPADYSSCAQAQARSMIERVSTLTGTACHTIEDSESICPNHLIEQMRGDSAGSWFGIVRSPNSNCALNPSRISPDKLEDSLMHDPRISLGHPSPTKFVERNCLDGLSNLDKNKVIAEYYYTKKRIDLGEVSTLQSIASINLLLGDPSMEGVQCEAGGNSETRSFCAEARKCLPNTAGFTEMVKETEETLKLLDYYYTLMPTKDVKDRIAFIKSTVPWVDSNVFRRTLNNTQSVATALERQFRHNKELLLQKLGKVREANQCVMGQTKSKCGQFNETLASTYDLPELMTEDREENLKYHRDETANFINHVRCLRETREVRDQANSIVNNAAVDIALTVATAGAGEVVSLLKVGTKTKLVARGARGAVMALDLANFGVGVNMAVDSCKDVIDELSGGEAQKEEFSCRTEPDRRYNGPNSFTDFKACAIASLWATLPNALPIAPPAYRRWLQYKATKVKSPELKAKLESLAKVESTQPKEPLQEKPSLDESATPSKTPPDSNQIQLEFEELVARRRAADNAKLSVLFDDVAKRKSFIEFIGDSPDKKSILQELKTLTADELKTVKSAFESCQSTQCYQQRIQKLIAGELVWDFTPNSQKTRMLAERQAKAREDWKSVQWAPPAIKRLPLGIPKKFQKFYRRSYDVLNNKDEVLDLMQEFERDVAARSLRTGESLTVARNNILDEFERGNGFKPVTDFGNTSKGPERRSFRKMLSEGALFNDLNFSTTLRVGHGELTHRIQWHLVMRDMKRNPHLYEGPSNAAEAFRLFGNDKVVDNFKWTITGLDKAEERSLWYQIFDSGVGNATCPEYFHGLHKNFPGLGNW